MSKHFYKWFTCCLFALLTVMPARADVMTVNDDATDGTTYIPVYGSYVDTRNTHTQSLYLASDLEDLSVGATITSLKFFLKSPATAEWGATLSLKLAETDEESLSSSFIELSNPVEVYNGNDLSATGSEMVVTFTTPYVYQGGNLVVDFLVVATGSWKSATFYASIVSGMGRHNNGSGAGSVDNYQPKMEITYTPGAAPACPSAKNLAVASTTTTTATFTWEAGGEETAWDVAAYKGETRLDSAHVTAATWTLATGLTAGTTETITLKVYNDCGADGISVRSSKLTVTTECAAISVLPYVQNFDGANVPNCWTLLKDGSAYPQIYTTSYSNPAHTGSYTIYFYGNDDNRIAVMPELATDANQVMVSLWEKSSESTSYSVYGHVEVGVMNNPSDASTFVTIASLPQSSSMSLQKVFLSDAPAGYKYIAFRYTDGSSSGSAYIDDVTIDVLPTCIPVTSLSLSDITTSGATLTWAGESRAADQFAVLVKEGAAEKFNGNVTGGSLTLDTLSPGKSYNLTVSVTPVCGDETVDAYETTVNFNTNCEAITSLPWEENFDSFENGDVNVPCWDNEHISGSGTKIFQITTSSSVDNSTKMLLLPDQTAGTVTRLQLPEIVIPAADEYQFVIKVYRNSYSTQVGNEGIYVLAGMDTLAFIPRDYREGSQGVALNSVDIAAETAVGWYSYEFTLPKAGAQRVTLLGLNQYKTATYIDDLKIRAIPSCSKPSNAVISNVGATTAHLAWSAPEGSSPAYRVKLFKGDDVLLDVASTTETELDITGLHSSTSYAGYTLQITSLCDGGQESDAYEIVVPAFDTECEVISTFPWKEDFESFTAAETFHKACWTNEHVDGGGSKLFSIYTSGMGGNTTKLLQLPDQTSGTHTLLTLPEMNIPAANEYEFMITVYRTSASSYPEEGIYVKVGNQTLAFISRDYATTTSEGTVVPAESATGWYTYRFTLPNAGLQHIALLGQSKYGSSTYMDNLMVRRIPTCYPVEGVRVAATTTNSVTLAWDAPAQGGTSFEVVVKDGETEKFNGVVNGTSVEVSGFTPSTIYNNISVSIVNACSEDDKSVAFEGVVTFTTECDPLPAFPWAENFDSYTGSTSATAPASYPADQMPLCWDFLNRSESTSSYPQAFITSNSGYPVSGNCLFFKSSLEDPLYAILPEFTYPLSDKQITFSYRNEGVSASNGTLHVGYMTDASDAESYVDLESFAQTTTITQEIVMLNNVPEGARVAFKYVGGTANNYYLSIDNVSIEKAPSCIAIKTASITSLESDHVTFGWIERQEGKQYSVEIHSGSLVKSEVVDHPYITLDQLTPNTSYKDTLYIKTLCPDDDEQNESEVAVFPFAFKTLCGLLPNASIPYTQDFEGLTTGSGNLPDCWTYIYDGATNPYVAGTETGSGYYSSSYVYSLNGENGLKFEGGTSSTIRAIAMPGVEAELSGLRLKFSYLNGRKYTSGSISSYASTSYGQLTVGVMANPADIESFIAIETLDRVAVATEVDINFDEVPADYHYIAFVYAGGTSTGYLCIDDVVLEEQPACRHALDAKISNIGTTTATLSWTAPTTGGYKVLLKDGQNELFNDSVTSTSVELTNLEAGHIYSDLVLSITTYCDAENSSEVYNATLRFTTACDIISGDTITFGFEDYPTGSIVGNVACWDTLVTVGVPSSSAYWSVASTGHNSSKSVYLYGYTSDSTAQVLITPQVNIPSNGYEMLAYVKESAENENDSVNFYVNTIPSMEGATCIGSMKPTDEWTLFRANLGARDNMYILIEAYAFRSIYVDDIVLQPAPQCYPIQDNSISYRDLTAESVVITWVPAEGQDAWNIVVEDADGIEYEGEFDGASYVIEDLSANTEYSLIVSVTSLCDDNMESEAVVQEISFRTPLSDDMIAIIEEDAVVAIDLSDEDEQSNWALLSAGTNKFMFGEADGAPALFISDDEENWNYDNSATSGAIAFRQFRVEAENAKINVSFEWQANGESTFDYSRAFIAPVNTVLDFSSSDPRINGTTLTTSNTPTGLTSLSSNKMNLVSSWQSLDKDVVLAAGDYLLIFTWRNDYSTGNQYPLAVKNIVLADVTNMCDKPINLVKGEVTATTATFSWTAGTNAASSFEVVAVVNGEARDAVTVDAPNITISDLIANLSYTIEFSIVGVCENEARTMPLTASFTFRTPLPEDFDETSAEAVGRETTFTPNLSATDEQAKWVILGTSTNAFMFGNIEADVPGVYVSNNNNDWAYTLSSTSYAMVYRNFSIADDDTDVEISFDWQANGEVSSTGTVYDYGRAFIVAQSIVPEVTSSSMKLGETTIGKIAIVSDNIHSLVPSADDLLLVGVSSWQTLTQTVNLNAGIYRLVFSWYNDSSSGEQNPLGVKNISISNLKPVDEGTALDTKTLNVETDKFIRDGRVYILRDGVTYDILGTVVR